MQKDDVIRQPGSNVGEDMLGHNLPGRSLLGHSLLGHSLPGHNLLGHRLSVAHHPVSGPVTTQRTDRPRAVHLMVFGLAYVLAGGFGQGLPLVPGVAITFWPPAGIFLAALLLNSRSHWGWYVLVACIAELTCNLIWFHNPIPFALIYFMSNTLEALAAAWLLGRFAPRPFQLRTLRDVAAFVVIAAGVAPVIGATIIAGMDAIIGKHDFATAWPLVWLGDGTGMLFSTPIALALGQAWRDRETVPTARLIEAGAGAVLLVGVGALTFAHWLPTYYLTMPLVIWAAVRFQLRGAATALALVAVTAAVVTRLQADGLAGPPGELVADAVMLQTYFGVTAVSALLAAALSQLQKQTAAALQAAKRDLEARVDERTEMLGQERARLAIALRTGLMGVYEWQMRDGAVWWSPEVYPLYGVDPQTFTPTTESVLALVHPDDRDKLSQKTGASLAQDGIRDHEFRVVRPDGQIRWVQNRSQVALGANGLVDRITGVAADITERKAAEAALRERETRLRLILDGTLAFIGVMDLDGTLVEVNAPALAFSGLPRAEVLDRKIWEIYGFSHDQAVMDQIKDAVGRAAKGEIVRQDVVVRISGDARATIDFMLAPVRDDQGIVRLLVPSAFDITERKQAETALRLSHDTYLNLIEINPFGVYLIDSDFRIAKISAGAKKVFSIIEPLIGRDFEEVLRILWQEPFATWLIARFRRTLETGEPYHSNTTEKRGNLDAEESYEWQIERVTLPAGGFGVVCHFYDLSERKRHEQQIHYLMGEVNHRAKNLLAVVQAIAAQTARAGDPASFTSRLAERIQGLAAGHDLLVRNQWEGVGVAELARAQLAHFADMFDTRVLFDGPPLRLRPGAAQGIGMALHEMATNAAKYGALSNPDGRVRISWGKVSEPEPHFVMQWIEEGGPKVAPPGHEGFGNRVIKRMAEAAVDGTVRIEYRSTGFLWTLSAPLSNLTED